MLAVGFYTDTPYQTEEVHSNPNSFKDFITQLC